MPNCLCCDHLLLRHIRRQGLYWFCPTCRQEVPCSAEAGRKSVSGVPQQSLLSDARLLFQSWEVITR